MKIETREKLMAGADTLTSKLSQFPTVESMAAWAYEFSGRVHQKLEGVQTRVQITEMLDAVDEPSDASIKLFEGIVRYAPFLLNRFVKHVAKSALKGIESSPRGPKPALPTGEREHLCAFIGGLYAKGVTLQDAQGRAARKWGTSLRTVERVWAQRANASSNELSIDDAERDILQWMD